MFNPPNPRWPSVALLRSELATNWPLILMCILLCVIDIVSRVMPNGNEQSALSNRGNLTSPVAQALGPDLYALYMAKLSDYSDSLTQVPSRSPDEPTDVSSSAGARDDPLVWDAAQHSYRLVAIFSDAERFAVLQRTHNETAVSEVIEARVGDSLDGFVIASMSAHELLVTDGVSNTAELRLFEPLPQIGDGDGDGDGSSL